MWHQLNAAYIENPEICHQLRNLIEEDNEELKTS